MKLGDNWINQKIYIKIGYHLAAWIGLFILPYLFFPSQDNMAYKFLTRNGISLIQFAIIFYINYLFLLNTYLFQKRYVIFIIINCFVIVLIVLINWQLHDSIFADEFHVKPPPTNVENGADEMTINRGAGPPPNNFFLIKDFLTMIIPVIFSIALKATENWLKIEAEKKEIENKNLESELQHLRYQIQPHFFFNSLNNIYSLVEGAPEKAQKAIHSLSKLMRYMLYDTKQERVELSHEINFLIKYIQLMELRKTNKTKIEYRFPDSKELFQSIAPLLFIPLIENAYKHGVSAINDSFISFNMTINGKQLIFKSENSNFPKNHVDKSGSGIGQDNLIKRLELLYPNQFIFEKGVKNDIYWVNLELYLD